MPATLEDLQRKETLVLNLIADDQMSPEARLHARKLLGLVRARIFLRQRRPDFDQAIHDRETA